MPLSPGRSPDSLPLSTLAEDEQARAYQALCARVYALTGLELAAYKRSQMLRRTRAFAQRQGVADLEAFGALLESSPEARVRFLEFVTINVTEFFRDAELFAYLRTGILPELLATRHEPLVWSAGCATGAEAYSVRLLAHALAPQTRVPILGTDIDARSLGRARAGVYTASELAGVPQEFHPCFLPVEAGFLLRKELRAGTVFQRHDLLADPYPGGVDLILCRNVLIYLGDEAKQRLLAGFHAALRSGGYLLVGRAERLTAPQVLGFSTPHPHLYRKW